MIEEIITREWAYFQAVHNIGGRASCQDDEDTFFKQRRSQFLTYDQDTLDSYLSDLKEYEKMNYNPMMLKYAYMMETNDPEQFELIKSSLPIIDEVKKEMIEEIVSIQLTMKEEFDQQYPALALNSRNVSSKDDTFEDTSFETYLRCELLTYSSKSIYHYARMLVKYVQTKQNVVELIQEHTVKAYGYQSLQDANDKNA